MMVVCAVLLICAVVSTPETRAAGRDAMRPFARVTGVITAIIWLAVILLPHGD